MKIMICVNNLTNGGAERVASLWANGFSKRGNEVHLVICDNNKEKSYPLSEEIKVHNIFKEGKAVSRYLRKIWSIHSLMRSIRPDVAIAVLRPWNKWLPLAAIGLKTKLINTEHNSFERPESAPMTSTLKFEKYWLNKLYDGITVLTERDKTVYGDKIRPVFVLPNPLAFSPIKEINQKKNVILAVGRCDVWHYKGFDNLLRAWGMIAKDFPLWQLRIVGNANIKTKSFLHSIAEDHHINEQVQFVSFKKDVVQEYRDASIFVLSSRYEGFGLVLIEAMSQGCACVACDYKGRQREIIGSEEAGLLCEPEDNEQLAAAIKRLIVDEKLRESIQANAIERSRYFSLDNTMKRWDYIFEQVVCH